MEAEGFQQRVKTLDESEHRYKDENWNLETQIHELIANQKDSGDREKKLSQTLNILQAEKNQAQKELDEVKLSHSKLLEEHESSVKHHDIELGTAKRNAALAETERAALHRKIDDLTNQNQELARAFSSQRGRTLERDGNMGMSDEDFQTANDDVTPEHSPPPSPVKFTPRHSVLESETLKTSLLHAQRTIQSQRSQLHREKTEKLELKRMLQDSRDELEKMRNDSGIGSNRRSRKVDSKEFKKPAKALLGGLRSSKSEVFLDDPEWEEHTDSNSPKLSPTHSTPTVRKLAVGEYPQTTDTSDQFDTANETSDAAFETANERGTETEGFHTGAEEFSGDDAMTETESPSRNRTRRPQALTLAGNRNSFHSTASTSGDEDFDFNDIKTPIAQQPKMRLKVSRGLLNRRSRQASEEPPFQSSPASFATSSAAGTPQQAGQSLFAELAELEGSDDESVNATTPSRSVRSMTPASVARSHASSIPAVPPLPNLAMVDSGIMTDPVKKDVVSLDIPTTGPSRPVMVDSGTMTEPMEAFVEDDAVSIAERPRTMESVIAPIQMAALHKDSPSRPQSTFSDAGAQYDLDMTDRLAQFPVPPSMVPVPIVEDPAVLSYSPLDHLIIDPVAEPEPVPAVPTLSFVPVDSQAIEPVTEPEIPPPPPPVLGLSTILSETVEPKAEPEIEPVIPTLAFSSLVSELVEPVAEPEIIVAPLVLGLSPLVSESLEPEAEPVVPPPPAPTLSLSTLTSEGVEPIAEPAPIPTPVPVLGYTPIQSEFVEPQAEPEVALPLPAPLSLSPLWEHDIEPLAEPVIQPPVPALSYSPVLSEAVEPRAEAEPEAPAAPVLSLSSLQSQGVEPVSEPEPLPAALGYSPVQSWDVEPRADPIPLPPSLTLSSVLSEEVTPIIPPTPGTLSPLFSFSAIDSVETRPLTPRSPRRDGFILPRESDASILAAVRPKTPDQPLFGASMGRNKRSKSKEPEEPIIAEDDTRQSPRNLQQSDTPESQRPFKEISANSDARSARKAAVPMSDQGAQTSLTAYAIDEMFKAKAAKGHDKTLSMDNSVGSPGTVRVHRLSEDQDNGYALSREASVDRQSDASVPRRPGSASSSRAPLQTLPPLPANHRERIEAARTGSSHSTTTVMGPPLWPASAMRNQRPRTPSSVRPQSSTSVKGTPTPRALRTGSITQGSAIIHSPTKASAQSRRSSVSSFASEVDMRFNIPGGGLGMAAAGFGPNTDPRMIQAITQTMIGEYLWKYTRKAGRGDMSEKRHRRYFWVHPYTRTLYWSDRDPSAAGRSELKAKSVPIEAVRVVTDDNPNPPGLHRKSLIVISPGRAVKFTCTTGSRHETWFNALSYLLLRTGDEGQNDAEEMVGNLTQADVDEFNPQVGHEHSAKATRPRGPQSLSSYNSRTPRNQSPAMNMSMDIPTLTPTPHKNAAPQRPSISTLGRLSGYWKGSQVLSGTFSSLRSRTNSAQGHHGNSIYEASEVHDSAEDVREMIERQDREADRLENVRACCDGECPMQA